ncbi:hypothetical protein BDV28DRAFT_145302 [Aspergillus coremiiformis]|uniref:Uncharacterized protein n=1 Tax=Aspergillus coremiiformis TaxID=138285 RepID=A0A5N6ZFU3_9EURO|nr:hypothetical protein BDV28DRAFT_145302 [Aspergillus coremiiformis]
MFSSNFQTGKRQSSRDTKNNNVRKGKGPEKDDRDFEPGPRLVSHGRSGDARDDGSYSRRSSHSRAGSLGGEGLRSSSRVESQSRGEGLAGEKVHSKLEPLPWGRPGSAVKEGGSRLSALSGASSRKDENDDSRYAAYLRTLAGAKETHERVETRDSDLSRASGPMEERSQPRHATVSQIENEAEMKSHSRHSASTRTVGSHKERSHPRTSTSSRASGRSNILYWFAGSRPPSVFRPGESLPPQPMIYLAIPAERNVEIRTHK